MKNLYNYILVLALCLALSGCSAKIPITKWTHSGQVSGSIWYTLSGKSVVKIPLLIQAEWEDSPTQKGRLALVFLHGSLFAKCSYDRADSARLFCETNSSFPGAKGMADDCAMLVSAAINHLQGMPVIVSPQWNFTVMPTQNNILSSTKDDTKNELLRAYSLQKDNISIVFEIKEATWR